MIQRLTRTTRFCFFVFFFLAGKRPWNSSKRSRAALWPRWKSLSLEEVSWTLMKSYSSSPAELWRVLEKQIYRKDYRLECFSLPTCMILVDYFVKVNNRKLTDVPVSANGASSLIGRSRAMPVAWAGLALAPNEERTFRSAPSDNMMDFAACRW